MPKYTKEQASTKDILIAMDFNMGASYGAVASKETYILQILNGPEIQIWAKWEYCYYSPPLK